MRKSKALKGFAARFDRCFLCGTKKENTWPGLEIHHIVRGAGRKAAREERCVLIRTCQRCHQERLDGMDVVTQLAIKLITDPEGYARKAVNLLRRRAPEAITEDEVREKALELEYNQTGEGYLFPRWTW